MEKRAEAARIQYGGSVKAKHKELMEMPEIDGI